MYTEESKFLKELARVEIDVSLSNGRTETGTVCAQDEKTIRLRRIEGDVLIYKRHIVSIKKHIK